MHVNKGFGIIRDYLTVDSKDYIMLQYCNSTHFLNFIIFITTAGDNGGHHEREHIYKIVT